MEGEGAAAWTGVQAAGWQVSPGFRLGPGGEVQAGRACGTDSHGDCLPGAVSRWGLGPQVFPGNLPSMACPHAEPCQGCSQVAAASGAHIRAGDGQCRPDGVGTDREWGRRGGVMERVGGEGAEEGPQAEGVTPGHRVEDLPSPSAPRAELCTPSRGH